MAMITKSVVAETAKKSGMRVSASVYNALDKAVQELLKKAVSRAKANGRKTIMDQDI